MGNSKFWYYPNGGLGSLVEIDLGRTVTDMLIPNTAMRQASATAFTGVRTIVQWGGTEQTRIRLQVGTSTTNRGVRRKLVAMLSHMDRGGSVMFAVDAAKFYAGFLSGVPTVADTSIFVRRSMGFVVPNADVSSAELVLRSSNPGCVIEMPLCSGQSAGALDDNLTIGSPGVVYDYSDHEWVLVRELGSWPALRLPDGERGRGHLSGDHEIAFNLDLPVEEDEVGLATLYAAQGDDFQGTGSIGPAGSSLGGGGSGGPAGAGSGGGGGIGDPGIGGAGWAFP